MHTGSPPSQITVNKCRLSPVIDQLAKYESHTSELRGGREILGSDDHVLQVSQMHSGSTQTLGGSFRIHLRTVFRCLTFEHTRTSRCALQHCTPRHIRLKPSCRSLVHKLLWAKSHTNTRSGKMEGQRETRTSVLGSWGGAAQASTLTSSSAFASSSSFWACTFANTTLPCS